ncbi:L,D-transpeptidase family protein [Shewanella eurypsychrophilus]|uniref:L,D-transpeptidase family protein n=1 Tax=Shewanella eurypsychrophilus TaxID=2593656 RepID=A0ABX6VCQ1_9GAMM|nr:MULTISPECIES: L,D-transpeptidase family protein [Shewanella]QFU22961.1 L,D-transpeptidase family protein [Shewanella sp. YLB-09]QPG58247.1 L,D-transpeptidase family protein [Shewanella eurypsychrophilus]
MKKNAILITLIFYTLMFTAPSFSSTRTITATDVYQSNDGELIWFDEFGLTLQGVSFSLLMDDLGIEIATFLNSQKFDEGKPTQEEQDRAYTKAAIYFLDKIQRISTDSESFESPNRGEVIEEHTFAEHITKLVPPYDGVSRLRGMIRRYKVLVNRSWSQLKTEDFRLGQSNNNIFLLRQRLADLGDLNSFEPLSVRASIFDPSLIKGVENFQKRHGIEANGELNTLTTGLLNVTPQQRVTLMQLNLWRWFKLPSALPSRYVKINIPAFELKLLEKEDNVLDMKVIVGKPQTPTPTMNTALTQLTVNPSWTPPWSIVSKELIPRDIRQPGYLQHQNFKLRKLDDFTLVDMNNVSGSSLSGLLTNHQLIQSPGPKNALGRYRFTIPNKDTIFLHDTPTKSLFFSYNRALSHGCIRVSDPKGLSDYLMRSDKRLKNIYAALSDHSTHIFKLPEQLPVYITYHTSWVDELGKLQFRADIYNLDREEGK